MLHDRLQRLDQAIEPRRPLAFGPRRGDVSHVALENERHTLVAFLLAPGEPPRPVGVERRWRTDHQRGVTGENQDLADLVLASPKDKPHQTGIDLRKLVA